MGLILFNREIGYFLMMARALRGFYTGKITLSLNITCHKNGLK